MTTSNKQYGQRELTLDIKSILSDDQRRPYWTDECRDNQSSWWLPHISDKKSNFLKQEEDFWKTTISPIAPHKKEYDIVIPSSVGDMEREDVKATKKIRIYPKDKDLFEEYFRQQRRAYNLAIECFIEQDNHPFLRGDNLYEKGQLRKIIRECVEVEVAERGDRFFSAGCDEMIDQAFTTRDAVLSKRRKKMSAGYSFKSMKNVRQMFLIQRLTRGFVKKNCITTEEVPEDAYANRGRQAKIVKDKGRWFLLSQKIITTIAQGDIQARNIVAIDPGVRTFATTYSAHKCVKYGDGFHADRVFPLLLRMDALYGLKAKANDDQWKRHYEKRIHRLSNRVRDMVDDLHNRVAYELVHQYDVILLPKFETSNMVEKAGRKLRSKTVRSMLGLGHYRFQQKMKWMCKKNGKRLIIVNEAYTSKTRSWDGTIKDNLGGSDTIKDDNISVDRDVNGARGILLRALYGAHAINK